MDDCIFCKIVAGDIPSYKVYEDEDTLAFLDINPVNPGHTLIVPKTHQDVLWHLDQNKYLAATKVAKQVAKKLEQELKPARVGQAVEGFDVPHAHIHIIPIEQGLEKEFSKPKSTKNSPEDLEQMAKLLQI